MSDRLTPELRAAEKDVDEHHQQNPLLSMCREPASWYFLAEFEEMFVRERERDVEERQDLGALADSAIVYTKWPMRWIFGGCEAGGRVRDRYADDPYGAAHDLMALSRQYDTFESAFCYASAGKIDLQLDGRTIQASNVFREDTRYDAYDRLAGRQTGEIDPRLESFLGRVESSVRVSGQDFAYDLNPRLVLEGLEILKSELQWKYRLPAVWQFLRYRLGDFHDVYSILYVLAFVHFNARIAAAARGCVDLGYDRALILFSGDEVIRRVVRYTSVPEATARAVVEDLTYGERGVQSPDPILQPLVPMGNSVLGLAPSLVLFSSCERNLIVLLNKLAGEREAYTRLSQDREDLTRDRIEEAVKAEGLRCWSGAIPGRPDLGDVDVVIIDDENRCCLLLETKSFVAPAEIREVMDRSKEVARGVARTKERRDHVCSGAHDLLATLRVDSTYTMEWAVASETSIGATYVQDPEVAVIRVEHLLRRIASKGLPHVIGWLARREYLPAEGEHYEAVDFVAEVAGWHLPWYGIRPLVGEYE
jgi:hypothetical protein